MIPVVGIFPDRTPGYNRALSPRMRAPGTPAPWEFIGPVAGMFNTVAAALRYSSTCCMAPIGNVMPYVKRNAAGEITGLLEEPADGAGEELSLESDEIQAFLGQARQRLSLSCPRPVPPPPWGPMARARP